MRVDVPVKTHKWVIEKMPMSSAFCGAISDRFCLLLGSFWLLFYFLSFPPILIRHQVLKLRIYKSEKSQSIEGIVTMTAGEMQGK